MGSNVTGYEHSPYVSQMVEPLVSSVRPSWNQPYVVESERS